MGKGIFVTGTATNVGKTYVTAQLVRLLREAGKNAGYYKAALSGAELEADGRLLPGDAAYVAQTAGLKDDPHDMVTYTLKLAASPHLAARQEGVDISLDTIVRDYQRQASRYDYLTMEGSGGIVCPIAEREGQTPLMLTDIVRRLGLRTIVVADARLGAINAVTLTLEYCRTHSIPVCAVVLNRYDPDDLICQDNRTFLSRLYNIPIVTCGNNGRLDISAEEAAEWYQ